MLVQMKTLEEIMNDPKTTIVNCPIRGHYLEFSDHVSDISLNPRFPTKLNILGRQVVVKKIDGEGEFWWYGGYEFSDWQFTRI